MAGLVIQSPGVCTDRTLPMRNPLWTPAFLPGRKFDLDCDVGIVANGSNEVLTWTDQAQGIVMTGPSGARPVRNYAFQGHTAPRFTLDHLDGSGVISSVASHWCWWAVVDLIDVTTSSVQDLFHVPTASPNDFGVYAPVTNGKLRIIGSGAGNYEPVTVTAGKHILILSEQVSGTRSLRQDGVTVGTPQTSIPTQTMGTPFIGQYDPGMKDCAIAAMGMAAGVQTLTDIQKLEGYLAQRFMPANFLPVSHPYRSVAPRKLT